MPWARKARIDSWSHKAWNWLGPRAGVCVASGALGATGSPEHPAAGMDVGLPQRPATAAGRM